MINPGRLILSGIRRLQLRFARERVLVIGDSHAKIFRHFSFLLRLPRIHFQVAAKGGATASGLATPNSVTQAYQRFRKALDTIPRDRVIVQLGEVDTGYVIWYRAKKRQASVEDMFALAIKTYTHFLLEVAATDKVIVISAPLPTIVDGNDWGEVADQRKEVSTTRKQRTELTIQFNRTMETFCREHGLGYLNLDGDCLGEDGVVRQEYMHPSPKDHHYHEPRYARLLARRLGPMLEANENCRRARTRGPLVAMAALALLVLALALPGIRSMPVTDRDEARYAQASKQMVESGDYVQIRFLDEARNKKPAGIYWLHTLSVRLAGVKDQIWPYRLVSVAGALLAVLLVYLLGRRIQPDAPLLPAMALAACPLLICVAHAATTDAVMMATVCAAQLCLAKVYLAGKGQEARGKGQEAGDKGEATCDKVQGSAFGGQVDGGRWKVVGGRQQATEPGLRNPEPGTRTPEPGLLAALGFWTALGIGILIKGPITPLIAGLTILALCLHDRNFRWLRALRPALGICLLLLIVLPWLVAIQRKTSFLQDSVGKDFLTKVQGAQESHGAPPGAYLATAGFLFWPLFPLAWRGIGRAWQARRTDPVSVFLLAWLLPAWLLFELVPTKLPHYVLPLYPVLAFLTIRGWKVEGGGNEPGTRNPESGIRTPDTGTRNPGGIFSFGARLWRSTCLVADVTWWLGAAAFVIGPVLAGLLLGWAWLPAAFGCAAVAGVAAVAGWRLRQRPQAAVAAAAGFALLYFTMLFAFVLPRLDDLWLTRRVADMVATQTQGKPARVVSIGYAEPSMAFTFGSQTILSGGVDRAVQELLQNAATIVLIQDTPGLPPKVLPVSDACWARLCQLVAVPPKGQQRERFLAAAAQAGVRVQEVAAVDGLNYSRTKRVRVILFRSPVTGER
ncbi:MAG: glycosyltransferase family 39 protein [bacterium]